MWQRVGAGNRCIGAISNSVRLLVSNPEIPSNPGAISKRRGLCSIKLSGVHLTNILTKIVERAIASVFVPYFDRVGSFGCEQLSFRKQTFMSRFDGLTNLQVALGP